MRKKRQEEIEAKKKRLEELKRAKEAAAVTSKSTEAVPKPVFNIPTPTSPLPTAKIQTQISHERNAATESKSVEQDTNDLVSSLLSSSAISVTASNSGSSFDVQYNRVEKIKAFSLTKLSTVILPVERVTYTKECQTEDEDQMFFQDNSIDDDTSYSTKDLLSTPGRKTSQHGSSADDYTSATSSAPVQHSSSLSAAGASFSSSSLLPVRKISEEETQQILTDDRFLQFFENASLHIERALEFNTHHDILRDFTADTSKQTTSGEKALVHSQAYYESEFLRQRPVMDLKCSVLRPELFLTAYGSRPSLATQHPNKYVANNSSNNTSEEEAPGLICIWARDMYGRPEMKLIASSPVLTAEFHPSEPQLVFGGCYNGQILLWDMSKAHRSLPVQRSSWVAGRGHKHPVYALALTMSHELVSVSIDGMLCLWDVARLTEPITTAMLEIPVPRPLSAEGSATGVSLFSPPSADFRIQQPPLNVSCMTYASGESNASYIVVGSGAGELFKTQLPYKHTEPANLKLDAHFGLITAVHMHPMTNSTKYKHFLLTSSLDWTVKLWSMNNLQQPLFEFFSPNCDYICDVQWSPTHPAVFLTVSSTGRVSLWNMVKSVTEPVDVLTVATSAFAYGAGTNADDLSSSSNNTDEVTNTATLHKALFSRDGQWVLVGDSVGVVHRLKVHSVHVTISASEETRWNIVLLSAQQLQQVAGSSPLKAGKGSGGVMMAQQREVMKGVALMDDFDDDEVGLRAATAANI